MAIMIRETNGTFTKREPTIGKLYCGFYPDEQYNYIGPNGKPGWRDDMLAEYAGDGEFIMETESGWATVDFSDYEWIAEQG